VRRERAKVADAIGQVIERAQFRAINDALIARIATLEAEQRAAPDNNAAVLDLSDERRRRAGE
jgi:hypothetical protein